MSAQTVAVDCAPRALLLGKGWFPDQPGGLNRYFRDLLSSLPPETATGVVIGPAADAPPEVLAVSSHDEALPLRAWRFSRAALGLADDAALVDVHFALFAFLPLLAPKLRRLPRVVHFHGPWADETRAARRVSAFGVGLRLAIERLVYRRARAFVVLSEAFKDLLVDRYGIPPTRVMVVRPGVDLEKFTPGSKDEARARLGLGSAGPVVVAVRRLVPRMGLDVLVEAWARWSRPRGARLVIVGDGPARQPLELRADLLGVAGEVVFLGQLSDGDLVDCYRGADVCVMPSIELEGFGLVTIEALACGTPVICTDAGGLPEVIAELDGSAIVPAGDPDSLADRLAAAFDGRASLPDPARCIAHAKRFDWDSAVEATRRVFVEAVS